MCGVLIVIATFFFKNVFGQVTNTISCAGLFEITDASILSYAMEHNGKLPSSDTWQDDMAPYYKKHYDKVAVEDELPKFMRPPAPGEALQCTWEGRTTGIAFNVELSGKEISKIKNPEKTVLLFETETTGKNQSMTFKEKPKSKAPKVMYNEKDWIVYYVEGNKNPFDSSDPSKAKTFKINPEDALDKKDKKPVKSPEGSSKGTEE